MNRLGRCFTCQSRRGQAMVVFALFSVVLVGAVALSIDAGYFLAQRRGSQAAADSAALAGAKALQRNQASNIVATGLSYASASGFANGSSNTVTISHPPTSGSRAGDNVCVQATVVHTVQQFFIGAVYSGPWTVTSSGTACTELTQRPYALVALDPNGSGLTAGGNGGLVINNGGALSDNTTNICGTASWIQAEGPLDSVNGITICSNADVDAQTMNDKAAPLTNPLASVAAPNCGNLTVRPDPNIQNSDSSPITLQPGNYSHGITINGNDKVINFASGVYCFGDDLKTNGGSHGNTLKGSDVLFYFYGDAMFNINGGGNDVILDYGCPSEPACSAKIVIYYASANCEDLWLVGGNDTDIEGIIYAPCSLVHLGGDSGSEITGQVFGGSVTIVGGADLTINYVSDVETKVPLVYLVE